jgi:excisionase family DNA binding protein
MAFAKKYKEYRSLEDLPATFRVAELAEFMGINLTSAYELVRRDNFQSIKIGNRVIIPKEAFKRWLEKEANKTDELAK